MCGRSAQSVRGVEQAEDIIRTAGSGGAGAGGRNRGGNSRQQSSSAPSSSSTSHWPSSYNNVNMGPGMRGLVIRKSCNNDDVVDGGIACEEMVWGLVPKAGTKTSPLPEGPAQHYSNLMYNARSDTLYDKRTFRDLALRGQTAVVAVDGFYEWKESEKSAIGGGSGKQPYYVHRSDGKPLFIAGLWTSVPTGREHGYDGKPEMLTTYTLLTTDACPKLQWLHHRQPVFLWDTAAAMEWLQDPSQTLEKSIAREASKDHDLLAWYPVTKRMNKTQYRESDCNIAIKIEKVPSVKSFFTAAAKGGGVGKAKAPVETGPKDFLKEGWKEEAEKQMAQSKRKAATASPPTPSSPATKKIKPSPSSPSPARSKKLLHKQQSPPKPGQITSFFAAAKPKMETK